MKNTLYKQLLFRSSTTDGKLIEEHHGVSTNNQEISIAHMIAPPKWSEPSKRQNLRSTPILLKVKNNLVLKGNYNTEAGQSIRDSNTRVQYSIL
jgi:hypothetical protein